MKSLEPSVSVRGMRSRRPVRCPDMTDYRTNDASWIGTDDDDDDSADVDDAEILFCLSIAFVPARY